MISLKKLLAGVLSAAMVLGTMAIPAFADESTSGNAAKIGDTEYATLQDAFDNAKKDDTITILKDIELTDTVEMKKDSPALKGFTFEGNGKTIKLNTPNKTAIRFKEYPNDITIQNLNITGTANYAFYFTGGGESMFNNVNISGSFFCTVGLFGTHGAIFNKCNISNTNDGTTRLFEDTDGNMTPYIQSAMWTNVSYKTPVKLIDSNISAITINGYGASNTFAPKIYVDSTSKTNVYSMNDSADTGSKVLCVSPESTGTYTIQKLTTNTDNTIDISDPITPVAKADVTVTVNNSTETFETEILFDSLAGAVAAVKDGGTVTLLSDVTINPKGEGDVLVPQITIDKSLTLDLAGHTIGYDKSVASNNLSYYPVFFAVPAGVDVTITGNGTIDCEAGNNGAYGINVNGGNLTIENGTFYGAMTVAQVQEGSLNVKGGYYDLAPSVKSQVPAYAKYIINAIDDPYKDGSAKIFVTGGTFVNFDPSANPEGIDTSYVAKGYYSKDNQDGTFSVLQSAAKVIDNAKSAGVKVTLDNLEKNSAIDKTADATYNVVLDTVKPEDKAAVDKIKSESANKTVIAYDIYVAKTENGVTTEFDDVKNQKVTLSLPTQATGEVDVYHIDNNGTKTKIDGVTVAEDGMSVSFIAPSFSTYTFVYDAANLTANDITKNIKVEFEEVTDSEYDIVLKATDNGKKINGLLTADLTFSLTQGTTGLVNYEITPAANMSLLVNGNRYTFSFDGTNAHSATGDEIVIGKVKFNGYCTGAKFEISDATTNLVNTTKAVDSIVEYYVKDGDGTNTGKLNATALINDINLTQETANLTVNVSFPNAVVNQAAAYQNMKVTVSGNGANEVVKLGSDNSNVTFANDTYTVEFTDKLIKGNTYTVTVEGAGYRTARYTVSMTGAKTLNFWNNVKDALTFVEENVGTGSKTNFLAGDIVKDGQINIYDLSAVVSYFGTDNLVSEHPTYAKYDLNRDGVIDSKDVAYVLVSWGK